MDIDAAYKKAFGGDVGVPAKKTVTTPEVKQTKIFGIPIPGTGKPATSTQQPLSATENLDAQYQAAFGPAKPVVTVKSTQPDVKPMQNPQDHPAVKQLGDLLRTGKPFSFDNIKPTATEQKLNTYNPEQNPTPTPERPQSNPAPLNMLDKVAQQKQDKAKTTSTIAMLLNPFLIGMTPGDLTETGKSILNTISNFQKSYQQSNADNNNLFDLKKRQNTPQFVANKVDLASNLLEVAGIPFTEATKLAVKNPALKPAIDFVGSHLDALVHGGYGFGGSDKTFKEIIDRLPIDQQAKDIVTPKIQHLGGSLIQMAVLGKMIHELAKGASSTEIAKGDFATEAASKMQGQAIDTLNEFGNNEVDVNSTPEEIQQAYHRAIHEVHPDKGGSQFDAARVNNAYQFLKGNAQNFTPPAAPIMQPTPEEFAKNPQDYQLFRGENGGNQGGISFSTDENLANTFKGSGENGQTLTGNLPNDAKIKVLTGQDMKDAFSKGFVSEKEVYSDFFKQGYDAVAQQDAMNPGKLEVVVNPKLLGNFSPVGASTVTPTNTPKLRIDQIDHAISDIVGPKESPDFGLQAKYPDLADKIRNIEIPNNVSGFGELENVIKNNLTPEEYQQALPDINRSLNTDKMAQAVKEQIQAKPETPILNKNIPIVAQKYNGAEGFIKAKKLDPDSVLIKDNKKFIVENTGGNDALLTELPLSTFGKPKFETLNQNEYKPGQPIKDPIEVTLENGKYVITDGANRFTQAIANKDKTIPVILEVIKDGKPLSGQDLVNTFSLKKEIKSPSPKIPNIKTQPIEKTTISKITSPKDAAISLIKTYVLRGDTLESLRSSQMGESTNTHSAQIGGYINGKKYGNDKILITKLNGKPISEIFSLKDVYNEIKNTKAPIKKSIIKTYSTIHTGGKVKMVKGEPVKIIDGIETFLHKGDGGWIVSEASTGRFISASASREGTIAKAKFNIEEIGKNKLLDLIKNNKLPKSEKINTTSGFNPKNIENLDKPTEVKKETDKIIKRSEIANELSKKLGVPIRRGKFNRKALGIFKHGPQVVRIKKGGLPTVFHEIGHFLDDKFSFSDIIVPKERVSLMVEYGKEYAGQPKRQKQEAFAEFMRYTMTGQDARAKELAPEFYAEFQKIMKGLPEIKDIINTASSDYARWKEMPATAKVLSQISLGKEAKGSLSDRLLNTTHNLYTMALDDLHPLSQFSSLAKKQGVKLLAKEDPYILARNLRGWVGKANTFLEKGTFGKDYWQVKDGKVMAKFTGQSFHEIMQPIDKAGKLNDFRAYVVAVRALELSARKIVTGITPADAKEAIKELEKANPDFQATSNLLYKYQDDLLKYAAENGLIGPEGYKKIKSLNQYRVPFYRVMEAERSGFMGGKKIAGNIGSQVKKIKGSEREIIDPIESIIKDTYAIINAAERNNIGMAMALLAEKNFELGRLFEKVDRPLAPIKVNVGEVLKGALGVMGGMGDLVPPDLSEFMVTLFRPSQTNGPNMITVNFGDKQKVFHVDNDLFNALQGLNTEDVGLIMRVLAMPAKLLRAGATLTPDFSVRNPIKDQFSAYVYSKYGYKPGIDLARGIFEVFKKSDVYDLWRMGGGEHSMFVSLDREKLQHNYKELMAGAGRKTLNVLKNPIEALRAFSEWGEQATRLGEMRRGLAQMKDPIEAANASREVTLDFARIGAKTKAVNALVAFWNANVQGGDKLFRAFKEHPFRSLSRVLLGITLPSILLYLANRKDKRWKEIPGWQKDLFWIVMTPNHIYRIPKPFELGVIFGSVPERILEFLDTHDSKLFDQLESSVANGATPGWIPTGLLPLIENITNYSFFLNRPIISQGKQGLPPEAQTNTYTSEVAKMIGQALKYSPAKIDNLIQGYTGGLGRYVVNGIDGIIKGTGIVHTPVAPAGALEDTPVLKAFMIRPPVGLSSESVNTIYTMHADILAKQTYLTKLIKSGETEKAKAYLEANPEIVKSKTLNAIVGIFSDINNVRDSIRNSKVLSAQSKRDKIKKLDDMETNAAEQALELLK